MKTRRENGATLVSPMTSEVGRGSALMAVLLFWEAHSACKPARTQITCLRDVSRFGERTAQRGQKSGKKQGRRRSIPSTTLPAPDIEIGSRHPVNCRMTRILTGVCEPVHTPLGKVPKTHFCRRCSDFPRLGRNGRKRTALDGRLMDVAA